MVCHSTIYGFIQHDKAAGGQLYKHLRHPKPYKKRRGKPEARRQIIGRISIDERPSIVDHKVRFGDWEADTVIGKAHKGILVTLTERVSKKTLIVPVQSKHAESVAAALVQLLKSEKSNLHTITFDGAKYISQSLVDWASKNRITLIYIQPGKPTKNAYIERFNRTAQHEWLDLHEFTSVEHAQLATQWLWEYNNERPNTAIGGAPPRQLLQAA